MNADAPRHFAGYEAAEASQPAPSTPVRPSIEGLAATWRGMTGMNPDRPVATLGFMLFDGTMVELALPDLDLERLVRQVVLTVPQGWVCAHRSCLQPDNVLGRLTVDGSMPRDVGLQSPANSFANTSSGKRA